MKAVRIHHYGSIDSLVIEDVPLPEPKAHEVQIAVKAASINPFDVKLREGTFKAVIPVKFPITLGGDIAGAITKVGEGVTDFAVGDEVYGEAQAISGASGAFAEYAVTKTKSIAKKPQTISFAQAAAVVLTGVSALQALDSLRLEAGQKILIHGGAGGIGTAAIQLAKQRGAYIAATASGEGVAFARNLGADEVIDYKDIQFDVELDNYDVIFDTVGGDVYIRSFKVLKPGGVIVSMVEKPNEALAQEYGVTALAQSTNTSTKDLEKLANYFDNDKLTVYIAKTFPLTEIDQAFTAFESGSTRGKIVISF